MEVDADSFELGFASDDPNDYYYDESFVRLPKKEYFEGTYQDCDVDPYPANHTDPKLAGKVPAGTNWSVSYLL